MATVYRRLCVLREHMNRIDMKYISHFVRSAELVSLVVRLTCVGEHKREREQNAKKKPKKYD